MKELKRKISRFRCFRTLYPLFLRKSHLIASMWLVYTHSITEDNLNTYRISY